jgi:hypothetical protein
MVGRSMITEAGTQRVSLSRTGEEQKVASNGPQQRVAPSVRPKIASTDQILVLKGKTLTARLRIDRVAVLRASASRVFNGAALIVSAEEDPADSAETVLVAAGLAVIASVAAGLEDSAAVASAEEDFAAGAAGNNQALFSMDVFGPCTAASLTARRRGRRVAATGLLMLGWAVRGSMG